jgi:hypothetical protein
MELTNKYGAPVSIVAAIQNDSYTKDGADFSVTELISPPQIRRLWQEHEDEISIDVRDEMFKLLGTAVHHFLDSAPECGQCDGTGDSWSGEATHELWWKRPVTTWDKFKAWTRGDICDPCDSCDGTGVIDDGKTREKRFHANHDGTTISGAIDLIGDDGSVIDYKVTSTYSVMRGLKEDWEKQLNLYAWLLRQNGVATTSLNIVAICRDWTRSKVGTYQYPDSMVVTLKVPVWPESRQDRYLAERIRIHSMESTLPCTTEERWARGAYKVTGGKGRPKPFDSLHEAEQHLMMADNPKLKIVEAEAKYVRCEGWCDVARFCPQWAHTSAAFAENDFPIVNKEEQR